MFYTVHLCNIGDEDGHGQGNLATVSATQHCGLNLVVNRKKHLSISLSVKLNGGA